MGVKDVNLREKHLSEELPDLFLGSPFTKNVSKTIKYDYTVSVLREAVISVHSFCHQKESSRHPTFPHYPSQVSEHCVIKAVSVENGSEGSFEPEYDAGKQIVFNDAPISNGLPAPLIFKSKIEPEEEESQAKEIGKATLSSDVLKESRISFKWIIRLYLCFTLCRVVDAGGTHLVFPSFIELSGQVPPSSRSSWLRGRTTIQRNGVKVDNMSNQSLLISDQQIENYDLEIRLPDGSYLLQQFPVKVMHSCVLALDKEDLNAFKEGKKAVEVELIGEANVTKHYLLVMRNQTLQICYERGIERQLQLDAHVQCNAAFKDIDPAKHASSENSTTTGEKSVKEELSDARKYYVAAVAIAFIAGGTTAVICIVFLCLVKLQRRKKIELAMKQPQKLALESIESKGGNEIAISVV